LVYSVGDKTLISAKQAYGTVPKDNVDFELFNKAHDAGKVARHTPVVVVDEDVLTALASINAGGRVETS
jgi:hypothetical protein